MNDFDSIIKRMTVTHVEPEDYTGGGASVLRQVPHPQTVPRGRAAHGGAVTPLPLPVRTGEA